MDILGEQGRNQILAEWNQTGRGYPRNCAHQLFEEQASRTPERIALIFGERRLTYRELNERANKLAHHLKKMGAVPEVLVGLCLDRCVEAIVGIIGILKAGGVYLPLNPTCPSQRLEEIVHDSGLALAVTNTEVEWRLPAGVKAICLDQAAPQIATESSSNPHSDVTPKNAAYVLYTSGSTGKPKGVVGIHRSIPNGLWWIRFEQDEVACLTGSLSFGSSISDLFLSLMSGVPLVLLSDGQSKDIDQMLDVLHVNCVTRLVLVPPVFQAMLNLGSEAASKLQNIRTVGLAGADLTPALAASFRKMMPKASLHNGYSSTEIGTLATRWDVPSEFTGTGIVIGRPVANTRVYILDERINPVPIGAVGEIYVGAAHLARGYLNQPEMTAERFLIDPFSEDPESRLYRTGDLGRFQPNGNIEFLGRTDQQVKIRGFRVELAEVERVLVNHRKVLEAVASVQEIDRESRLAAYIVTKEPTLSVTDLRNHLQNHLPDYMIPSAFVFLERLPLTDNGKVDRGALPLLVASVRQGGDALYEEPRNPVEAAVAEVWSELLGCGRIGIKDNFLELGGDSLFAVQTASRLKDRFAIELPLEALFEAPTVAELAAYISTNLGSRWTERGKCPIEN